MKRIYIENDNAKITYRDDMLLDIEFYNGIKYSCLRARRLFPITGGKKYITLLDENEDEVAVIRNIDTLMKESRKAVYKSLEQYYFIPKIIKITDINQKYGTIKIECVTDHGNCSFEIRDRAHNLKILYDRRVLIRDTNDNRYEIANMKILDRKSMDILLL